MIIRPILTAFCVTVAIFASAGAAAHGPGDIVKPNFEQTIPNLPGKSLIAVEVEYPPGAGSLPHVHAESAFIYAYVVSGAVESKVNDGDFFNNVFDPEKTFPPLRRLARSELYPVASTLSEGPRRCHLMRT